MTAPTFFYTTKPSGILTGRGIGDPMTFVEAGDYAYAVGADVGIQDPGLVAINPTTRQWVGINGNSVVPSGAPSYIGTG